MHRVRPASQQRGPPASLAPSVRGSLCMRLRESCSGKDCGAQAELTGNSSRSMGMGDVCGGRTESMQADKALRRQVCPNPPSPHGSPSASPTARLPPDPTWRPAAARASPKRPGPHPAHSSPQPAPVRPAAKQTSAALSGQTGDEQDAASTPHGDGHTGEPASSPRHAASETGPREMT